MNKKKIIFDILILIAAFLLFVLWYTKIPLRSTQTAASHTNTKFNVYLITMDRTDEFWYNMDAGASDMADLLGINYTWLAPIQRNAEEQNAMIQEAVNNNADAIMIAVVDPDMADEAIRSAKEAGVKIIYVDAPANEEGIVTLSTNNFNAGVTAGENMINELASYGITSGTIGILGVTTENITTINREAGFRSVINRDGRFTLADTKYVNGSEETAHLLAESFIQENPDLVGLFGTNELTTISVGDAIRNSGKQIIGIGFDFTESIRQFLNEDILQAVLIQNPYTMGYLGMAETYGALQDFPTGPAYIDTGIYVMTRYTSFY